MSLWLQNLLVVLAVAACVTFVARQAWLSLAGKKSKLGSCCASGCAACAPARQAPAERIIFLPAEMLGRRN
jgi:quinolinate synthase